MSEPRPAAAGPAPELAITGGPGSFAADLQDVTTAAHVLDRAGDGLREAAGRVTRLMATGDLLAAAPICPISTAVAEARIAATVVGPFGLLPLSALCEGMARGIAATVATYQAGDLAAAAGFEAARHQLGALLGSVTVVSAVAVAADPGLALALLFGGAAWAGADGPAAAAEALAGHPEVLDTVIGLLPGYVEGAVMTAPS
ncbi:MAG TPA: hypothetical protein VHM65_00360, partial [Candidatus Lustribacter sp.]|nr:hypothetical protein [Candidatus Lustribacter sp.]